MKPLVSVIVTTRNNEHTINRLLSSVVGQTYKQIELIVVDNFSTDRTVKIAKHFTKKIYSRGPERSAQRNFGYVKSKGNYLLFLDSDMELKKDVVENCVKVCTKKIGAVMIDEEFLARGFWSRVKALEKKCYTGTGDAEAARFFHRNVFTKTGGYDEFLTGPEDIDLHKRVTPLTSFGRTQGIIHYDEHLSFFSLLKKRFYYSSSLKRYFAKHPGVKEKEFKFIRNAFLKNWKVLANDPLHFIGFIVLRIGEGVATLFALLFS